MFFMESDLIVSLALDMSFSMAGKMPLAKIHKTSPLGHGAKITAGFNVWRRLSESYDPDLELTILAL